MQECGRVHLVEAMNGSIYLEDIAMVKSNSNWACDPENYEMLVVGDMGRAALFDISMECKNIERG